MILSSSGEMDEQASGFKNTSFEKRFVKNEYREFGTGFEVHKILQEIFLISQTFPFRVLNGYKKFTEWHFVLTSLNKENTISKAGNLNFSFYQGILIKKSLRHLQSIKQEEGDDFS